MSADPQLFRINPESRESEKITEIDFARLGFQERRDIQEWVANNPGILGDDLLIIGKEFSGFDRTNERLDLLAVDLNGKLVIIELKRDDSGSDAHWQAIKYASYFRHAEDENIVSMLAAYKKVSEEDAKNMLLRHLGTDDFNSLNHDQRIILASHRFAPEVTSAALWLNEKSPGENLITCVQLTPYQDGDSLYIQTNTIIPLPGVDDYAVGIGEIMPRGSGESRSSFATKLQRTFDRNKNDEVTSFVRKVGELTISGLPDEIKPDRRSNWGVGGPSLRHYQLWYSSPPWRNWVMSYRLDLFRQEDLDKWRVKVFFGHDQSGLVDRLKDVDIHNEQQFQNGGVAVNVGIDDLNDDFAEEIANMVKKFIHVITPIVNEFLEERAEELAP